jgi:hypothetical protein
MTILKECNVLGSGPSRKSYIANDLPSIGCNFPWTRVDKTVIFDSAPIIKLLENNNLIPLETKIIISNYCYDCLISNKLYDSIKHRIDSIIKIESLSYQHFRRSTGHLAAEVMIYEGYNKLNLYGMDNYFGDLLCLNNFSHQEGADHYIENLNLKVYTEKELIIRGDQWRKSWNYMIKKYKHVEFNFIK